MNLSAVLLGLHLARAGFTPAGVGGAISLGLAACALATLVAVFAADRAGRRRSLVVLALLMAAGGSAYAWTGSHAVLWAATFLGMMNGMGRDRGAALTIEQAMLPRTTTDAGRTGAFARYNLAADVGSAAGALLATLPAPWMLYAGLCAALALLASRLSAAVEAEGFAAAPVAPASPARSASRFSLSAPSRPVVTRFAALGFIDSLGGGFLGSALVSYWFFRRFGLDESFLGPFFFAVRILNALSHLGAAWLARRIGLVNTMVFTHLPSSLLLLVVPAFDRPGPAIALFLVREALVEMDVPTRQSWLAGVLPDRDRTAAAGITNLVRNAAWAVAPGIAGALMSSLAVSAPLVTGATLKIGYDLLLFRAFRHRRTPEELEPRRESRGSS